MRYYTLLFCLLCLDVSAQKGFLYDVMRSDTFLSRYDQMRDTYELQIIYVQIDRQEDQAPRFSAHTYQLDTQRYFYPASTVKLPVAALAYEKMRILGLEPTYTMHTGRGRPIQTDCYVDTLSSSGRPSVDQYCEELFLISDNHAYNRLYEMLGQQWIQDRLHRLDIHPRIKHRLSVGGYNDIENAFANPYQMYHPEGQLSHAEGLRYEMAVHPSRRGEQKGVGYYDDDLGEVVSSPFDFSNKNFYSIADMAKTIQKIVFHEENGSTDFAFHKEDQEALLKYMGMRPRESQRLHLDEAEYPDPYVKFFMFGGDTTRMPDQIRIFNKVGWAYGYLTDAAYIVDLQNNVEFILVATIHVNANRIYNDGVYEYEAVGLPFFKVLGQRIYEHELSRHRAVVPDLSRLRSLFK